MLFRFLLLACVWIGVLPQLSAQPRLPYEALRSSNRNPAWYRQSYSIGSPTADSIDVSTVFRIPYSSIVFKKADAAEAGWSAELTLTFDAMTATRTPQRPPRRSRSAKPTEPETALGRVVWSRTVVSDTYERTQSDTTYVEGTVTVRIPNQRYRMVPLIEMNDVMSPITSLPAPEPPPSAAFATFVTPESSRLRLVNFGTNIVFGRQSDLVVGLNSDSTATVELWSLKGAKDSTLVWSSETSAAHRVGAFGGFRDSGAGIEISTEGSGLALYRFDVTTRNLENQPHRVMVKRGDRILHRVDVLPRWFDIPTGLLNLETAIDLMRFALSADGLRELRKGSAEERERHFNAYWKPRDPTPESAYNELMAVYFQRIDQAYDSFTTPTRPGFDSPMGKTWIQYGKPASVDRRFPPEGGTVVVWEYPGRRFIFRATSGFGDFELVSPP